VQPIFVRNVDCSQVGTYLTMRGQLVVLLVFIARVVSKGYDYWRFYFTSLFLVLRHFLDHHVNRIVEVLLSILMYFKI
jgi:hypothetical protein